MSIFQTSDKFKSIGEFREEIDRVAKYDGQTPLYKFLDPQLNDIFMGGLARPDSTNIILIYGPSGVGKTLFATNIVVSALKERKRVTYMMLEDDPGEIGNRLDKILGSKNITNKIPPLILNILSPDITPEHYEQSDALEQVDYYFKCGFDLVILDHIQFLFESTAKERDEWVRQRIFIQKLNRVVKKHKKSLVIIAHVHKGAKNEGMELDAVTGSNSVPQVATKAFGIWRQDGDLYLKMTKSRYSKPVFEEIPIIIDEKGTLRYKNNIDNRTDEEKERDKRIANL